MSQEHHWQVGQLHHLRHRRALLRRHLLKFSLTPQRYLRSRPLRTMKLLPRLTCEKEKHP